jgi:predicted DNA-binding transcriptional regulator AlpA
MTPIESEPLLIDADACAALCGCGRSLWYSLLAAGKIGPLSVRLGRKRMWRAEEIRAWILASCPDARTWAAMQASTARRLKVS